jgi:hypothetical protein
MRLHEWQSIKGLVKAAKQLSENETFIQMVQVLEAESPLNLPLAAQGPTSDDRSHRLGLIEGYNQCLRNLKATCTPPLIPPEPLKARFRPPEQE